jgi:hypothetical protein
MKIKHTITPAKERHPGLYKLKNERGFIGFYYRAVPLIAAIIDDLYSARAPMAMIEEAESWIEGVRQFYVDGIPDLDKQINYVNNKLIDMQ